MSWFWTIFVFSLLALLSYGVYTWVTTAYTHYGDPIKPGDTYRIDGREYKVPDLPLEGEARVLDSEFMSRQRSLLGKFFEFCREHDREAWLSGGTLLAAARHKTIPLPWDDDADVHTDVRNIGYFYSADFGRDAKKYGLEAFVLRGSSDRMATKEGGAVRVRWMSTKTPTMDIFFTERKDGKVVKIDSWFNDSRAYSSKEVWDEEQVYPIANEEVDLISVGMPADPEGMVRTQYGDGVMEKMYARPVIISHETPFSMLSFAWREL